MSPVERENQTIDESPTIARRSDEQAVHRRGQPKNSEMVGESAASGGYAVDPDFSFPALDGYASPDACWSKATVDVGGNGPASVAAALGKILTRGAAETATRRKERYGFKKIGLARPVRSGKGNWTAVESKVQHPVIAKAPEFQAADHPFALISVGATRIEGHACCGKPWKVMIVA